MRVSNIGVAGFVTENGRIDRVRGRLGKEFGGEWSFRRRLGGELPEWFPSEHYRRNRVPQLQNMFELSHARVQSLHYV